MRIPLGRWFLRRSRSTPRAAIVGGAILLALLVTVAALSFVPSPRGPPVWGSVIGSLSIGGPIAWESRSYFGLDTLSPFTGDPTVAAEVRQAGFASLSFGFPGESVNLSDGTIYTSDGVGTPYVSNTAAQFVQFCELTACRSVMGVPGEIDDPGAAALTVRYVEQTLGFSPTYWEVGNEPIAWTHFGIPWVDWKSTDHSTPTPGSYATMVGHYLTAMRSVDPSVRLIGIQSDAGAPYDTPWFSALVSSQGPNLSAVAYHSYAGGLGFPGNTADDFFATLSRAETFPYNYGTTVGVVKTACPSCHISVFVGEYNAARLGNFTPFVTGYEEVPYIGAGMLVGLQENVSGVFFFALAPNGATGLLRSDGSALPVYSLFSTFFSRLAVDEIRGSNISAGLPGLYDLVGENASVRSVFVVNTNTVTGLMLNASSAFAAGATLTACSWGPYDPGPHLETVVPGPGTLWSIPPEGILLLDGPPSGSP